MVNLKQIKKLLYEDVYKVKAKLDNQYVADLFIDGTIVKTMVMSYDIAKMSRFVTGKNIAGNDRNILFEYYQKENNRNFLYYKFYKLVEKNGNTDSIRKKILDLLADSMGEFELIVKTVLVENAGIEAVVTSLNWMVILASMGDKANWLEVYYKQELNKYITDRSDDVKTTSTVKEFLLENKIVSIDQGERLCEEIPYEYFYDLRKLMIDNARGTLYIAGETLANAFGVSYKNLYKSIIVNISEAIKKKRIHTVNNFLGDPSMFLGKICAEPFELIRMTVNNIFNHLSETASFYNAHLNIYFLPYLNIDHVVITDNYMLSRCTKILTNPRDYKGSIMIYGKNEANVTGYQSEYDVNKKYFDVLAENSECIDTSICYPIDNMVPENVVVYREFTNRVYNYKINNNFSIELYRLYDDQLTKLVLSSFWPDRELFSFDFKDKFQNVEDIFEANNLLGDNTQKVLLPYIKQTGELFKEVIRRYDKSSVSGAQIIPSLDLGYPNNVLRLAGGFATGMLIEWECGVPIIPVDATVNVCTSSVFKVYPNKSFFDDFILNMEKILLKATNDCGFSFSFLDGNHFLMFSKDENGDDYLVMHSSVKEMKNSYTGLYPNENNWYAHYVESFTKTYENGGQRYLRYIKGKEAEFFVNIAHNMEKYNEKIHEWLAVELNNGNAIEEGETTKIIKHHYYMPTDSSIAIGTFVEEPGQIVPLFSDVKKPIYLFKIGKDNWTYHLGGEKKVCIVPHGWGQQMESVEKILNKDGNLILRDKEGCEDIYKIESTERLQKSKMKNIRDFTNGQDFLDKGQKYLSGEIIKTLTPTYLYCHAHRGKVEE